MPFKVLTLVGTRPELIKLCMVIRELERRVEHVLVHTGQNYDYELNEVFFKELGLAAPKYFLEAAGATAAATVARVIEETDRILRDERPDALLVLGDTNSCMGAYAAKRLKIPVFHMEAGNRCFDQRVPEEINRRMIDHLSDINLTYTEHARRYLLREGAAPDTVIKTGSPMGELLQAYSDQIREAAVLDEMKLEPGGYFVLSCHREENVDEPEVLRNLRTCLERLTETYGKPVIFSVHPRTRARLESQEGWPLAGVIMSKPFGLFDYIKLQQNAFCVLSDSGTLTEESSLLDFPAIMLRQAHERPEGMDEASVVMSGLDPEMLLTAVDVVTAQADVESGRRFRLPADYVPADVSRKVVRIILSYTDFVRRTVWKQYGQRD